MRAAFYTRTGAPAEVLETGEVETPEPAAGEVLVRVALAGVNPTDCKRRSGQRGPMPFPRIVPGYDAAGTIEAVGGGVDPARIGSEVWVWEGAHQKWDGTSAELVRVPASRAMPLPEGRTFAEGASLGVPAITAAHALRLGGPLEGRAVLVTGGAGAVGQAAVALAAANGARVIATARGPEREAEARAAGAAVVTGAGLDEIEAAVMELTGGEGVATMLDVDLGAHLGRSWRWVAQNGTIASFGSASDPKPALDWPKFMYRNIALRGVAVFEVPEDAKLAAAAIVQDAFAAGRLPRRIAATFALDRIAEAHEMQETGRPLGKILVQP